MLSKHFGFTLVELIIVLILLGILSAGAYISWQSVTINLGGQAQQIANDIRYTQSLSMSKNQRYRFVIVSSTTYQVADSAGTAIKLSTGATTITLNSGITFGSLTNLPNSLVVFDGKGAPYTDTGSPGTALSSTASIPIVAGSEIKTIQITAETGRVTVQ